MILYDIFDIYSFLQVHCTYSTRYWERFSLFYNVSIELYDVSSRYRVLSSRFISFDYFMPISKSRLFLRFESIIHSMKVSVGFYR